MANNAIQQDQLDYVKKSKVTTMLSGMMQQVILAQPEDPLTFLQELLTKPDGRGEEEQATLLKEIHNAVDKHAGGALVRWHAGTARARACVCVCVRVVRSGRLLVPVPCAVCLHAALAACAAASALLRLCAVCLKSRACEDHCKPSLPSINTSIVAIAVD